MSRVYSVKSNARRDARKLGLDPDLVVAKGDGWVISYPAPATKPARAKAKPSANKPGASGDGDPKRNRLIAMLADWTPIVDLMSALGWQAHTVRGALSTAAKKGSFTVERRRVDGVTSYRVFESEAAQ